MKTPPLGYLFKRAQQALRANMDEALRPLKVTVPQFAALSQLSEESPLSGAELARRSFVTAQTMAEILGKLEGEGWVRRKVSSAHARVTEAELTESGRQMLNRARTALAGVDRKVDAPLSATERQVLAGLLQRCIAALEE